MGFWRRWRDQTPDKWDTTRADWEPPAGFEVGTQNPAYAPEPACGICGDHPESAPCPYRQHASTLIDVAAGGWLADHPSGHCYSGDPGCRGECGG